MQKFIIHYQPITELKPNPRNPRIHKDRQIKQIARSIERFGFVAPILVDRDNRIIAGHGRLLAAQKLGLTEVPTICVDHLSEAEITALMIADNKLTENSEWSEPLLAESLRDLSILELDFSLEITGFTMAEIDLKIEGLEAISDPAPDAADDISTIQTGPAVSKLGDVWQLGQNRLIVGNTLDPKVYDALMQGEKAAMALTDPPYNVPIDGHCTGLGANKHREFPMASGEMSSAEFVHFLTGACQLLAEHSIDGSIHFICIDWRHVQELLTAGNQVYTELKNICVWVKDNGGMGSLYRSQHEFVVVFKHGKAPHRNNVELGKHGRYRTNVWNYPGANSFSRKAEADNPLALHPTVKPVAMIADAIMDVTARGDIVLDCFLGSGSTLIAAEKVGRRCYGIELDPLYVDTTIRRWQKWTGDRAIHVASGKSFDELVAEAEVTHD
jgi:DNA modification methylase